MTASTLRVEHVLQPALLCRDLDATMDRLHLLFGLYPSERVRITFAGVHNAVYALGGMTFLELIEPFDPKSSASRLLERSGEGWHMLSVDLASDPSNPLEPAAVDAQLGHLGVKVVHRGSSPHVRAAWHLHPRDTGGVLLLLALRADPDENRDWAGAAWREYVASNSRVIDRILGVSLCTQRLEDTAERYRELGFRFGGEREDRGDRVLQADCPRGTFLQLRSPASERAPCAALLASRGPGLFHLALRCRDLEGSEQRLRSAGVRIECQTGEVAQRSLWTAPETTFGVPLELRGA